MRSGRSVGTVLLLLGVVAAETLARGRSPGIGKASPRGGSGSLIVLVRDSLSDAPRASGLLIVWGGTLPVQVETDSLGRLALSDLPAGRVIATPYLNGYVPRPETVSVHAGRVDTLVIRVGTHGPALHTVVMGRTLRPTH